MSLEIRDALHGDIVIGRDEARLLQTFEMQRLRQVRQLGNVHLVYPSANHTRLEHCLGARWLAQKLIRISNLPIGRQEEQLLYKSALIHDASEPCFEHVTERLQRIGIRTHEEVLSNVLDGSYKDRVRENQRTDSKFICDVLNDRERDAIREILLGKLGNPAVKELISSCIDADNLDYIQRDSFYCGLPYGSYDDRIFASFRTVRYEGADHLALRNSVDTISAAMSILNARFTLWKTVYMHHAVLIADEMFLQALNEAFTDGVIDEYDIYILGDYELLKKLSSVAQDSFRWGRFVAERLLHRELYKRAYVIDRDTPNRVTLQLNSISDDLMAQKTFVEGISQKAGLTSQDVLTFFYPCTGWKQEFKDILVVDEAGNVETLGKVIPSELELLRNNYQNLWKFVVAISKEDFDSRKRVNEECQSFFSFRGSYVPKRSLQESKTAQELIVPTIAELKKSHRSSYNVLNLLLKQARPYTREDIARELRLRPSSVSHYLAVLSEALSKNNEQVLICQRDGRKKSWRVNEEFRSGLIQA
jgi:hypothetical protein